ncbi:MAG: helical backbone metal receptor [Polyangiaceae bacterium]
MLVSRRALLPIPLLLFAGCKADAQRQPKTGDFRRVISLSPGTTEAVFALEAGARLVGRSRYCDYPPGAKSLPSVGGFVDPSLEAILGLSPDLVVGVQGPGGSKIAEQLSARGIASYFPETDTLAQIDGMLRGLGERLQASDAASRVTRRIDAQRASVAKAIRGRSLPRAVLLFGLRPIVVAGKGGFADEILRLSGARNVVSGPRYPTIGIEQLLALDPDVLIDATGASGHEGETVNATTPGFRELRAVKNQRLISLHDDRVLRPGPRIGEGLVVLAHALHPGIQLEAVP